MAAHIYTQTIHRTTQITTNVEECGPCPVFASFTLAFALQLRKKHGKPSARVRKTSQGKQNSQGKKNSQCKKNSQGKKDSQGKSNL